MESQIVKNVNGYLSKYRVTTPQDKPCFGSLSCQTACERYNECLLASARTTDAHEYRRL